MWSTSSAFNDALAVNRRLATRVDVLSNNQIQSTLDVVMEGSVTAEDQAVRRSGTVRLIDPEGVLTPVTAKDLLAPRGTELRLYKGLYLPGVVDPELVPLGTLRISQPKMQRTDAGLVIDIKGFDRARAIAAARFGDAWQVPNGTLVTQAISDIITSRSSYPTNIYAAADTSPELVFDALSSPWDAITQLASAISYEVFFDVLGTFIARPVPNYAAANPVWTYEPGDMSLLLHDTREMDDSNSFSGVIVTSEHPDHTPIRVEVWDTDPSSPTYFDPLNPGASTFGPVPYGYSSPILTTELQATIAGQTILNRVSGLLETVTVETIGHFGHEVGDVIAVNDPDTRLAGTNVVKSITQPIRSGSMTITMQARRVANS